MRQAYHACVSVTGEHQIFAYSGLMRIIQGGWVFTVFLLAAIYTANLTTMLVQGRAVDTPLQGLQDLMERDKVLCLNKGSANAFFFNPDYNDDYAGLQIYESTGTSGQISDLVGRLACDAAELTREDLYDWRRRFVAGSSTVDPCEVRIMNQPITKRSVTTPCSNVPPHPHTPLPIECAPP